ncbi:LysR family transcriptional regulator [Marinicaulis flavus]|uniref:LysR family transcriptional regulator n=2 Tax=Hyphococcus luteus TaxID=2058213 RepID=A0A2S7K332_9PROT|nr:LysR family transcriptional regulator [Marinicaulis flavus]
MANAPNIWRVKIFTEIAATGSVSVAAARLGLTQPAASQALKALEKWTEAALFERKNNRLALTPAGAALAPRARAALALLEEGLGEAAGREGAPPSLLRAMSGRRLETLISIIRHGGFANAAKAEGYAAPTVHRSAKDLERALGAPLFEATSHGVRPTRRAEALALKAGLAFGELRQGLAELRELSGREAGATVIGAMPLARAHLAPAAAADFAADYPEHRISILDGAYEDLLIGLRRGETDFLIGAVRENPLVKDIVEEPLFEDPLSIVMRAGHPALASDDGATAFAKYPWIAPRPTSPLRRHFDALFTWLGVPAPEDVIECNSLSAARVLMLNSNRMMLLSDLQIGYEKSAGMLASRPHPAGQVTRLIGLTMRRNWRPTAAQKALVDAVRAQGAAAASQKRHPLCPLS